jgi:hypothetical protein
MIPIFSVPIGSRLQAVLSSIQRAARVVRMDPRAAIPHLLDGDKDATVRMLLPLKLESTSGATHLAVTTRVTSGATGRRCHCTRLLTLGQVGELTWCYTYATLGVTLMSPIWPSPRASPPAPPAGDAIALSCSR